MREIQLYPGEAFHLKNGFVCPGMGAGWFSTGPMWTWTEADMKIEMGWCMGMDCQSIQSVSKGEMIPQAIEVCCEMPLAEDAKKRMVEKKFQIETELLALGAKEVWFAHWGENDVVLPSENGKNVAYSTGVFMGVK
jgi:hypothetical protein